MISRYDEDISWSECFQGRRFIYHKHEGMTHLSSPDQMILPNVGREGHSYLHYIVTHYNDLPPAMVFTQGNPSDHVQSINTFINDVEILLAAKPDIYLSLSNKYLIIQDMFDPLDDKMPLSEYWNHLFVEPPPPIYPCFYAGIFYTSRNRIHKHPPCFYKKLYDLLDTENCPYFGYVLERLWYALFCGKYHVK